MRTDVYSLGVVLYQLLTGKLPIDPRRLSMPQAIQAIREEQPPRPRTLNKSLDSDLETIVLKAIEKERDQRYQSASAISDDIHRFLARQPILARPPSTLYQLRKLVARHKLAFGAGIAVVLVSISAAIVSTLLYVEAQRAKQTAIEQQYIAEHINAFLIKTFASTDPREAQGRDISLLRELVDNASKRIETELAEQPRIQAALDMVVGQVYLSLGLYDEAESHLLRALASRRAQLGLEHKETLETLATVAILRADQGRIDEAINLHLETLDARLRMLGEEHPATLTSMNDLGDLYRERMQTNKAKKLIERVVALRRKVLGNKHPDTLLAINNLASVLIYQRKSAAAEKLIRESLAAQLETLPETHLDVLVSKNDLALALNNLNKNEEAEALYRSVYRGFKRQLGEEHLDTLIVGYNLAELLAKRNKKEEAFRWYQEILVAAEQALPKSHYLPGYVRGSYAARLFNVGRLEDARPFAEQGCEELKATLGMSHPYTRTACKTLAAIYEALGITDQATSVQNHTDPVGPATENPD